ncbi:hypothetical protein [Actinomadura atramentaria]|uniref:hypothetical protein n=1 Tax=Actinomadura atramentaria TaxID=1990 RepID=UPI0012FC90DE|nr:hypothetical protein [Actinomadura atramentaria]
MAKKMQRELDQLTGSGSVSDVESRGNVPASAFGTWDAAQSLAATVVAGNRNIARLYDEFVSNLAEFAAALSKMADNYRESDEKMLADIRSINPSSGPAPTRSSVKAVE